MFFYFTTVVLEADGIIYKNKMSKKYDLPKNVQLYLTYKIEAETAGGASVSLDQERMEHEKVKKEISKLKYRKLKGELHEADIVEFVLSDMLLRFRNKLLSVPTKLAPMLLGYTDANQVIDILKKEVVEVLEELSDYDPEKFIKDEVIRDDEDPEDEEDTESGEDDM